MRGLLKIGMIVAIGVLFGVATWAIARWRAGEERHALVRVVVEPPPPEQGGDIVPVRANVGLYLGSPRPIDQGPVVIDEDEVDLEQDEPRFSLHANEADGSRFFVHASVEMGDFNRYCAMRALPRVRAIADGGEPAWVDAKTGRPLPTIQLAPRGPC